MSVISDKKRLNLITKVIEGKLSELNISSGEEEVVDVGENILKRIRMNSGAAVRYKKYINNESAKRVVFDMIKASKKFSAMNDEELERNLNGVAVNSITFNYLREKLLSSVPKIGADVSEFNPRFSKEDVELLINKINKADRSKLDAELKETLTNRGFDAKEAYESADLSNGNTDSLDQLDDEWFEYYKEQKSLELDENYLEEVEENEQLDETLSGMIGKYEEQEYAVKDNYENYKAIMSENKIKFSKMENMFVGSSPKTYLEYSETIAKKGADDFISKIVQEIRNIKAHNVSDEETGLVSGDKISKKNIHRIKTDMKVFEKTNVEEEEEAELSVYIGLDFSGSTSGGLDKQIQTIGVALAETFERLEIMHTIIPYNGTVSIATRGKERSGAKYTLSGNNIKGHGGNDEDQLLRTVSLLSQGDKEEDILVIIITDGDGSGEASGIDFLKRNADGKNVEIHSVGLAYDGGTYTLERAEKIYGPKNAHRVIDKKQMHRVIGKIVKQSVLRKEG